MTTSVATVPPTYLLICPFLLCLFTSVQVLSNLALLSTLLITITSAPGSIPLLFHYRNFFVLLLHRSSKFLHLDGSDHRSFTFLMPQNPPFLSPDASTPPLLSTFVAAMVV
ncbi:hypothetical protein QVD17_12895 [Tagetes erecta]|uniref:Uncharacterized protein n=1 Tax=Tagetes erecta TaxID=13708 RepID=A0AAD8L015_TARER|nr:hypothetical protein QVD17_12895 [Tagetes erecta]